MRAAALAAALILLIALVGCNSDDDGATAGRDTQPEGVVDVSGTEPVGQLVAGSVAAMVNCRDWERANDE